MECPICYHEKKDIYACEICNHVICMDCKNEWGRDCPFCRQLYSPDCENQYIEMVDIQYNPVNSRCTSTMALFLLFCGVAGYIGFTFS